MHPERVPLWLRNETSKACRYWPLHPMSRRFYSYVAKFCAEKLSKFHATERVTLRAKPFSQYDPGISDLDFWMYLKEPVPNDPELLRQLRALYLPMRTYLFLPGKMEVTCNTAWSLVRDSSGAWSLPFLSQLEFKDRKWRQYQVTCSSPARAHSRFSLSSYHYALAMGYLPQAISGRYRYYHSALFRKDLRKASLFLETGEMRPTSVPKFLAQYFVGLENLAMQVKAESHVLSPAHIELRSSSQKVFHKENCNLRWFQEKGFYLRRGPEEGMLIWTTDHFDVSSATRLFECLQEYYVANPKSDPFQILSRSMLECLSAGSFGSPGLSFLDWDFDQQDNFSEIERLVKTHSLRYVYERAVTRLNTLLGVVVSYPVRQWEKPLISFCVESLTIASAEVTNDRQRLFERGSKKLPQTAEILERLESSSPLNPEELIRAFCTVREECLPILKAAQSTQ